jgi:hypothetical protein
MVCMTKTMQQTPASRSPKVGTLQPCSMFAAHPATANFDIAQRPLVEPSTKKLLDEDEALDRIFMPDHLHPHVKNLCLLGYRYKLHVLLSWVHLGHLLFIVAPFADSDLKDGRVARQGDYITIQLPRPDEIDAPLQVMLTCLCHP